MYKPISLHIMGNVRLKSKAKYNYKVRKFGDPTCQTKPL